MSEGYACCTRETAGLPQDIKRVCLNHLCNQGYSRVHDCLNGAERVITGKQECGWFIHRQLRYLTSRWTKQRRPLSSIAGGGNPDVSVTKNLRVSVEQ